MRPIRRIVIVGGGTSAWLTAAYFANHYQHRVEVMVIDKEDGETVGVGEATILSFKGFMDDCGFKIQEWFDKIDATFKGGILFSNWNKEGEDIWHPFGFPDYQQFEITLLGCWSKNQDLNFKTHASALYSFSLENKVDPENLGVYAFHIDCGKLVKFLKEKIIDKITFINSEVVEIKNLDDGGIDSLVLKNGNVIHSDLFIDCTGFKRIISPKSEPIILTDRLFCDTAVAGHIPYIDRDEELHPYVICDAVEHGWIWNIPISSRIGSGLVFNRSITDPEEAKDFFVKYWDNRVNRESLRVIDWTPYYHEEMWQSNVVSIGLSAGFIEPLESTGVALICAGIWQLAKRLTPGGYGIKEIAVFNAEMFAFFENAVDFVNMHYYNSNRGGKFWEWVKKNHEISDTQKFYEYLLDKDQYKMPQGGNEMFSGENWTVWLSQLGSKISPKKDGISDNQSRQMVLDFYKNEMEKRTKLVHHSDFIEQFKKNFKTDG